MIAAVVFSCATARTEMVDRIVANVNGEIILYSELQEQLKLMVKQTPTIDLSDPAKKSESRTRDAHSAHSAKTHRCGNYSGLR